MKTLVGEVASKIATTKTSKQQLAARMGVTTVTLDRKLSGKSELMLSEAVALASFLDMTLQEVADLAATSSQFGDAVAAKHTAVSPFAPAV